MAESNVLIYLIRRDLRVSDNPILHRLATSDHGFTHLLPLYVFPPHQMEISGLLKDGRSSPYPKAKSAIGGFWRCGPHRAKFVAQSVWNMRENLETLGSTLTMRAGAFDEVLRGVVGKVRQKQMKVGAVWMVEEEAQEEKRDEASVSEVCSQEDIQFQLWPDEKYFIDDRDSKLESPQDLPDIYTSYRKLMEPLREKPRSTLPTPKEGSLPTPIDHADLADQEDRFEVPLGYEDLEAGLLEPLKTGQPEVPPFPEGAVSAHPFAGGEDKAQERLHYLVKSGHVNTYKDTRNGLMGTDFSTKLSAYLAQGCITARQVHEALVALEDGTSDDFAETEGYGQGENEGTKAIRFELHWRDYMRLCTRKFKSRLFYRSGFRDDRSSKWKSPGSNPTPTPSSKPESDMETADEGAEKEAASEDQTESGGDGGDGKSNDDEVAEILRRLFAGTTGMGLIDASQRELLHTGYTSNRARQNVASFLAKHLCVDWRWGAEWYESLLVDYDVSSNWANWQYVAGVGNDPRGEARIFNPVKQAFEYDPAGDYVRRWLPELRALDRLENLFQPWTTPREDWARLGLEGLEMAENPVKKIDFVVEGKPKSSRRPFHRRHGRGRGGSGSGSGNTDASGQHHGQAPASDPPAAAAQHPGGAAYVPYGQAGTFVNYSGHGNARGGFRGGRGPGHRGRGNYGGGRGYRGGGRHNAGHAQSHAHAHWQHGYMLPHRPMQQQWVPSFIPPPHPHPIPHPHPHPHMHPHPHQHPIPPPPPPPPQ